MKTGRVVLFFVSAFGSIIIPVVILMLVAFLTYKPPFSMAPSVHPAAESCAQLVEADVEQVKIRFVPTQSHPNVLCGVQIDFNHKGRAILLLYGSEKEAGDKTSDLLFELPTSSTVGIIDLILYQRSDNQAHGMLFQDGPWVILSEAATEDGRRDQLEALPFLIKHKKSLMSALFEDHLPWFFAGLGLYLAALVIAWPRMASWAAQVDPAPGIPALDVSALKKRILSINDLDLPFSVQPGRRENEFTVDWKYADAKWAGPMAAGGVKALARIRLRLDPEYKVVRAQDSNAGVRWQAHGNNSGMGASLKFSWFKGIEFYNYSRGSAYGLVFKDGRLTIDQAYDYTFDRSEMKNPFIDVVTGSGWTFRPVVSFIPLFN